MELVRTQFFKILRSDPTEWNLSKKERLHFEETRQNLRNTIRECGYGDPSSKLFIQEYMKDFLQKYGKIDEQTIYHVIPFRKPQQLTEQEKFLILLNIYSQKEGKNALASLIQTYKWDRSKYEGEECVYEVDHHDLEQAFYAEYQKIEYEQQLEILVQLVYENYLGCGIVDRLLDMELDGVSAGVSNNINSIWIFFRGNTIHFPCLCFEKEEELIRVCRILYRYGSRGQLTQSKGYMTSIRKDGSRVVVMRPPFAESWAFFVRKFDIANQLQLRDILKQDQENLLFYLLKWIVKGCQVVGITGEQGSGKTTLLMALIDFIPIAYTIRVQELNFELQLRKRYPNRNILSLRETETISGQESLDILKKTDGTVTILGEVATHEVAGWLIQVAQTASRFTMFTHHAKTTKDFIDGMRNSLLQKVGFQNEQVAVNQVVSSIRFDIHMKKTATGERLIERITEIVPTDNGFELQEIVVLKNGRYELQNSFSESVKREILYHLTPMERQNFLREFDFWKAKKEKE